MRLTFGTLRRILIEASSKPDSGEFKVGDFVLFGKYKNKKGKITDVYEDDRGHVTIDIEPVPKGRKKTVTMGLYKVWKKPDSDEWEEQ